MKINTLTLIVAFLLLCPLFFSREGKSNRHIRLYPANNAKNVNPDTRFVLDFHSEPILGNSGKIRIYDASNDAPVDVLDMGIPPGPLNTRTPPPYDKMSYKGVPDKILRVGQKPGVPPESYQRAYIGGTTKADLFHFYPVLIHGTTATICPHNHRLEYNKTYYIRIDPGVLSMGDGSFSGITGKTDWTFSTKKAPPPADSNRLVVSADGTGDFNTVQGAIDFIPETNSSRITVFIKNGRYEEIVYFRNRKNITFLGEDRDKTVICYANNSVFNPRPWNVDIRTGYREYHNRRAVFAVSNSSGIRIVNLTLKSIGEAPAQAEGLLILGRENIVSHVNIHGSGDALQATGSVYLADTQVLGYGDNVLGSGPAFFNRCDMVSTFGPHLWVRNTDANHGDVFIDSIFRTVGDVNTVIARAPTNGGRTWPHCEAVLINCALEGVRPEGWGPIGGDTTHVHYWEYNSTNLSDGTPVDMSKRHPASKRLTKEKDAEIISDYSNTAYVLGGWTPSMAPLILSEPEPVAVRKGQTATFKVKAAAVPDADYQWFKNDEIIGGETEAILKIENVNTGDAASYHVVAKNKSGSEKSRIAVLTVE